MKKSNAFYLAVTVVDQSIFLHAYHFAMIREIGRNSASCSSYSSIVMPCWSFAFQLNCTVSYLCASSIYSVTLYEHPNWTVKLLSLTCLFRVTLVTCAAVSLVFNTIDFGYRLYFCVHHSAKCSTFLTLTIWKCVASARCYCLFSFHFCSLFYVVGVCIGLTPCLWERVRAIKARAKTE